MVQKKSTKEQSVPRGRNDAMMGIAREIAKRHIIFLEKMMDMLLTYPHYLQYDDAYKRGCSYVYFQLYEFRKRLIGSYFKKSRIFLTYPRWIIDKKYDSLNRRQFETLLSGHPDYFSKPTPSKELVEACEKLANDFKKTNKSKPKKGISFTFDGKNFFYKKKKFTITTGTNHFYAFSAVFAMAPNGGEVEMTTLKANIGVFISSVCKMNKKKLIAFVKNNLVSTSSGFAKALESNGIGYKKFFTVEKGTHTVTFNNTL